MSKETASSPAVQASGSSFYAGMRMLPKTEREAMYAIYGFCRAVDDIADDYLGDRAERASALDRWRRDLDAAYAGRDPGQAALVAEPIRHFDLDRADFEAVIDGMAMDVARDICWPSFDELDLYCDRVASAVGRLSVKVFGLDAGAGRDLAHHLGRALQLTNILRDVDEDAAIGRLYLPREALQEAGITSADPHAVLAHPALGRACAPIIARIREHFARADAIMNAAPRRAVRAPRIMGEAYKVYFNALIARGFAPPREKVRIGKMRLLWVILRYAVI